MKFPLLEGILSAEKKQEAPESGLDHSLRTVSPELYKWELRCKDAESNSKENKEPYQVLELGLREPTKSKVLQASHTSHLSRSMVAFSGQAVRWDGYSKVSCMRQRPTSFLTFCKIDQNHCSALFQLSYLSY